jgi:hypothetical protein
MLIARPTQLCTKKSKRMQHLWMMTSLHIQLYLGCLGAGFMIWACKSWPFWLCWCSVNTRMVAKLDQITTCNTTQHTRTNMSRYRCHRTLQRLSPLSILVWQRHPQILAPRLSHECMLGVSRRVCACCFSSPCMGHPNVTHQIIDRGGVPWP